MGRGEGTHELKALLGVARKSLEGDWLRVEGPISVHASPDTPNLYQLFPAIRGGRPQPSVGVVHNLMDAATYREALGGGVSKKPELLEDLSVRGAP